MMRITKNAVDALHRIALAEFFTSPTQPASYNLKEMIRKLQEAKYVWHNGSRFALTAAGSSLLRERLSIVKTLELDALRNRGSKK